MFFLFSTGSWSHVKRVNLCNNLEVNSFSELISLCVIQSFSKPLGKVIIYFSGYLIVMPWNTYLKVTFSKKHDEKRFQSSFKFLPTFIKIRTEGNIDYRKWIQILN